ncbi:Nucleoside diphosphate kinase IV, chloroplastic/mitochondrial [Triticum urartu]|uniref:Nucleoside diphosphate kinase n=1 Tax=Triticum urartu TaxID=4572 RepID=M8APZ6_TRIUA|nr:Nucleoside diphosphate kinase IV, chloroplastic/mitochondrial [Triticum urartu]
MAVKDFSKLSTSFFNAGCTDTLAVFANMSSPRRRSWTPKRVKGPASLLQLLSIPRIRWSSSNEDDDKIELTRAQVESLRSEIADADERESQLKARLENIDEVLRYARLSGYLHIRSRWTQLPGEPPIIDDADVDDWLPRFVVLQGQCLYYYLKSTDLSPQESTLLRDVVEVGQLPNFVPEDGKTRYAFFILTRQGLRFECSSSCEIQVDSWVRAVRSDCKLAEAGAEAKSKTSGGCPLESMQRKQPCTMERTFIAIKPDGVQRGLISEIVSRFERKGYKLVAIKLVVPSKQFAEKHYHDLKERPFFSGLCDFLSSGPVLAMVWEGEGVIKYGRKLIGATDPSKSEPGTIRGDLAVVVGRNIIHGSDGPETAKDEIALWFQPKELVSYTSNEEKWIYGVN